MPKYWHKQEIIAAIRMRGTSLHALARLHGFSTKTFNKALDRRFPRAHRIIAEVLGVSRHELWPHWYDERDQLRSARAAKLEAWRIARGIELVLAPTLQTPERRQSKRKAA